LRGEEADIFFFVSGWRLSTVLPFFRMHSALFTLITDLTDIAPLEICYSLDDR